MLQCCVIRDSCGCKKPVVKFYVLTLLVKWGFGVLKINEPPSVCCHLCIDTDFSRRLRSSDLSICPSSFASTVGAVSGAARKAEPGHPRRFVL